MAFFKFILNSSRGELQLENEPIGWDSMNRTLSRSSTYWGLFRKFTGEYTFDKDGFNYLQQLYETEGINASCTLTVYQYRNNTASWLLVFEGKFDFSTYKESYEGFAGIKISITDNSFSEKIKNRENVPVLYSGTKTLDGDTIVPFANEYILSLLYGLDITENCSFELDDETAISFNYNQVRKVVLTADKNNQDSTEFFSTVLTATYGDFFTTEEYAVFKAEKSGTLFYNLSLGMYWPDLTPFPISAEVNLVIGIYSDGSLIDGATATGIQNQNLTLSGSFSVQTDYYVIIQVSVKNTSAIYNPVTLIPRGSYSLVWSHSAGAFEANTVLPFEAFTRVIHSLTGQENAFDSDLFGRTDSPTVYTSDGEYSHIALTNGYLIRNFPIAQALLTFTFRDLFKAFENVLNIGAGIEYDGSNYKFVIRKKEDFFTDEVVLDFGIVNQDSFEKVLDTSIHYSDIEIGYAKSAYEEISGLKEYNNKAVFSTIISALENKLSLISDYRADGSGITFAKQKNYYLGFDTEDTQYDTDNWLIELHRYTGEYYDWEQRTTEDFETPITGLEYITKPVNLNLTPKRNLLRWGWMLSSGLQKYADSLIKYNSADKYFYLRSQRTDEDIPVTELADINVSDLQGAIMSGKIVRFKTDITAEQFATIEANPYGLISYTNPITGSTGYGWIKELSTKPIDKETNIELYEALDIVAVIYYLITEDERFITTEDEKLIRI